MITGTWMEKENYRMHGQASQNASYWTKGHLMGTHGLGGDLQENKQLLAQTMCGQICGRTCLMQQRRKQNKNVLSRSQKLDNARQLRGIFFIEPNDEEFKLTIKAARRKLEVPMPAAMPCKKPIKSSGETHRSIWKTQDKICLCCWCRRKHETKDRRSSTQTSPRSYHWKKGWILWIITILFTNSFRCLKQWKFWMQRQQW